MMCETLHVTAHTNDIFHRHCDITSKDAWGLKDTHDNMYKHRCVGDNPYKDVWNLKDTQDYKYKYRCVGDNTSKDVWHFTQVVITHSHIHQTSHALWQHMQRSARVHTSTVTTHINMCETPKTFWKHHKMYIRHHIHCDNIQRCVCEKFHTYCHNTLKYTTHFNTVIIHAKMHKTSNRLWQHMYGII